MIKPHQFTALAAATAVSVLAAAVLHTVGNRWSPGRVEGQPLVAGLERQEKAIAAVEVIQGDKRITLERADAQWRIKERAGYPANPERVRTLLNALAQSQLAEPKTAAKDKYKALELEDPTAKDAKSRQVRVLDAKGKALVDVVLGKSRFDAFGAGKGGTYVRRAGEAQTWLATGEPKAGLELKDWAAATVFDIDQGKIAKITLEHPGEAALVVEKGDGKDAKFKLDKMPEGKKLKQGVTIDQIGQGFASIEMEDVRKLEATPTGDKVSVLRLEADGGMTVTFRLRKDGEAHWLSLTAQGADGDAKKAADELNKRASGWEFRVPQWKVDQIGKRAADLFETS